MWLWVLFDVALQEKSTSRARSQSSSSTGSAKKEKKGKKKKPVGGVALFGPSSVGSSGSGGLFGEEDDDEEEAEPVSGKVCAYVQCWSCKLGGLWSHFWKERGTFIEVAISGGISTACIILSFWQCVYSVYFSSDYYSYYMLLLHMYMCTVYSSTGVWCMYVSL